MKIISILTAALAAAVAILVVSALPPARLTLRSTPDHTVPGIIHVHTRRSDGRGTPDDVAQAAARQGLTFVVLTDHGDATREPDTPVYRSGVLCIDAVEVSTTDGHYLALGLPRSPYPLNGEARDVVEDVRRLGGWGIVAHPESPKDGLSWRAWDTPFDAIEWINPDTSWRVRFQGGWRSRWAMAQAFAAYPFRSAETIARLVSGTALDAATWNRAAQERRVVIVAGADAHARLGSGSSDPAESGVSLPIPSYDASFGALSVHVTPARALTGDAARDAAAILDGLRRGHVYVAVDGLAAPPEFQFTAVSGPTIAAAGDELPAGEATLTVASNAPAGWTTSLLAGTAVVASVQAPAPLVHRTAGSGAYRVEITAPTHEGRTPWIVSNPIYVGVSFREPVAVSVAPGKVQALFDGQTAAPWRTEHDPMSTAALDVTASSGSRALQLAYRLAGGTTSGQFSALAVRVPGEPFTRVRFSVRGERPGRLEVQARGPVPPAERWQRSVYFDESERVYAIDFADMTSVAGPRVALSPDVVRDILFVIDTTHTQPGASGRLWFSRIVLEK